MCAAADLQVSRLIEAPLQTALQRRLVEAQAHGVSIDYLQHHWLLGQHYRTMLASCSASPAPYALLLEDDVLARPEVLELASPLATTLEAMDGRYLLLYWANYHGFESEHIPLLILGFVQVTLLFLTCKAALLARLSGSSWPRSTTVGLVIVVYVLLLGRQHTSDLLKVWFEQWRGPQLIPHTEVKTAAAVLFPKAVLSDLDRYLEARSADFLAHDQLLFEWAAGRGYRAAPNLFNHIGLHSGRGNGTEQMKCGQQDFLWKSEWLP